MARRWIGHQLIGHSEGEIALQAAVDVVTCEFFSFECRLGDKFPEEIASPAWPAAGFSDTRLS